MTAVQWLMDKYRTQNGVITAADYHTAKEMEKQQIIDAYKAELYPCSDEDAEQYYNETFNK